MPFWISIRAILFDEDEDSGSRDNFALDPNAELIDAMRPLSRLLVSTDVGDLGHEVRRLFEDLAKRRPDRRHMVSGECLPLFDVFETERTIEIVLDVPGVMAEAIRILIKAGVVLVAGEKERPEPSRGPASFHLVERDFGRFARAVRVHAAIDASQRTRAAQGRRAAHHACRRFPSGAAARCSMTVETDGGDRDGPGMKLLFIGDIVARPGRELVRRGAEGARPRACDRPRHRERGERRRRRRA